MADGLMREFANPPAALRGQWVRDRVYGGMTRRDLRYNLRRDARHHRMVCVYTLEPPLDGTPNSLHFAGAYDSIERALRRVQQLDRAMAEAEARAEYDRLMLWAR